MAAPGEGDGKAPILWVESSGQVSVCETVLSCGGSCVRAGGSSVVERGFRQLLAASDGFRELGPPESGEPGLSPVLRHRSV